MAMPAVAPSASKGLDVRERMLAAQADVCASFQERQEVVRVIMLALLAEVNALLLGQPGTAKSAVLRALSSHVTGCSYSERLMSKFTLKDDLVGPPKVSALRDRDEYVRNMVGTPGDSDIFFCDEVFRASGAALDALLGLINEHIVDGIPVPLRVCVGASNMGAKDDYLAAIDDRFLLRLLVDPIQEPDNFDRLLAGGANASKRVYVARPEHSWSKPEWELARGQVCQVGLPPHVRAEIRKLWEKAKLAKIYISDRRWKALVRVLQACAWLDGCQEIETDHLDVFRHGLWLRVEDRDVVKTWIDTLDSGDVKWMVDQGDTFIQDCTAWSRSPIPARNASASAIMAKRESLKLALASKSQKGSTRTKAKAKDVWARINDAYLPVGTNLCQQMGVAEPESMARTLIYKGLDER